MDIHVWQLPAHATKKQLEDFLEPPFAKLNIDVFYCDKRPGKTFANITVLDELLATRFLDRYGVPPGCARSVQPKENLVWHGNFVRCTRSHHKADNYALAHLAFAKSEKARKAALAAKTPKTTPNKFDIDAFHCGVWDYTQNQLVFITHYDAPSRGKVSFGSNQAAIVLEDDITTRVDIHYQACYSIVLGGYDNPEITFTLKNAPKFYHVRNDDESSKLADALRATLAIRPSAQRPQQVKKKDRMTGVDREHSKIAGSCLVYRITLSNHFEMSSVRTLLSSNIKAPATYANIFTPMARATESLALGFGILSSELTDEARFGLKPFSMRYQLERLARNCVLPPRRVVALLPKVASIHAVYGLEATLSALIEMVRQIPIAGPGTDAGDLSQPALESMLEDFAKEYGTYCDRPGKNPYEIAKRHTHIKLIHRIIVTPCGIYLEGPEPEPTNRVIRTYGNNVDDFARVLFADEDGSSVRYDPVTSQIGIFDARFRGVLDDGVIVAGKSFGFLGFSHSSLRSQCCWFMASFWTHKRLADPSFVLKQLGDFTHIRVPAKCAARIGQNFTDTNATIDLNDTNIGELAMVQRGGYDFADGVGTISAGLLRRVWQVYGQRRALKPTAIQIRYKGYKGMVALDSSLSGERLMLRSNMKKYDASTDIRNLEICGAGFKPLPMVLNRQFIKIFEDLGIASSVFMDLQKAAIDKLRNVTTYASSTAAFLEESECCRAAQLPSLINYFRQIGLDWRQDSFLPAVLEIAIVNKLREIKYRARIPVKDGVTLYGIMDETGELEEGEIFVVKQGSTNTRHEVMTQDRVVVTRSPALHPGDMQIVKAVDVSADSPLRRLSNVVVFSQHGARDLPSQLSGGDLDGDLYNVIFDPLLVPSKAYPAAGYPRVSAPALDRNVTSKDMSDFFVDFMKSDMLGPICNLHMQLADQHEAGTFHSDCIKLAQMASTAVDFSKTGIPVNMAECPRHNSFRPDFMSPSPRIIPEAQGTLNLEEDEEEEDDDAFGPLEGDRRPIRYYESTKVLGQLFRDIDEKKFIAKLHQERRSFTQDFTTVMAVLLKYMKHQASRYGNLYDHHKDLARDIRAGYEECLLDILYFFGPSRNVPVLEHEAFAGTILGRKTGIQGKPLREQSKKMRERFGSVVEYILLRIVKGDEQMSGVNDLDKLYDEHGIDREVEAFPRALACLEVALEEKGKMDSKLGELESFKYVAAGVCLRELELVVKRMGGVALPSL